VTLEKCAIATAVLTAFREICELRPIHFLHLALGEGWGEAFMRKSVAASGLDALAKNYTLVYI
jgi:hypothetical protein